MPHNLYLHSALVQTRRIGRNGSRKAHGLPLQPDRFDHRAERRAAGECAILVLAAMVFFKRGIVVTEIQQANQLLSPLLGTTMASVLFGVALLCSGQSSTLTGTMAGQIVMEGFLNIRMRPWLRRLMTRTMAIIPAAFTVYSGGRAWHLSAADSEPGDPEHAAAVRRDSADPLHQQPRAHGSVRQSSLGAGAGLGDGGGDPVAECLADDR